MKWFWTEIAHCHGSVCNSLGQKSKYLAEPHSGA